MNDYKPQPPKEYKTTMDYKGEQIRRAMDDKQEAIKISSAGRDAVLIVSHFYQGETIKEQTTIEKREELKTALQTEIIKWRDWLYKEVYTMSDEKYRELNNPF